MQNQIYSIKLLIMFIFFIQSFIFAREMTINVQNLGAVNDGKTVNTKVIQTAIDKVHNAGGGTVYFPPGQWMTGKIFLKSNITLDISPKATLLAAPGPIYGKPEGSITSLIYGNQLENITITGGGTIEGKTGITRDRGKGLGRRLVGLEKCKNVKITHLTITHGGGCTILLHSLDNLNIEHVKVHSFYNHDPDGGDGKDGVNLDGSRNVKIFDCEFLGSDDAFAFKARTSGFRTISENIIIERCVFSSRTSNAIQFGSETHADFRNITIKDCRIEHAGKAGIGITMNDGHIIENITYKNITMRNVCTPFYIGVTTRNGVGQIRNIRLENIKCSDISSNPKYSSRSPEGYWVSTINGLAEMPVENIVFQDVSLHYKGGVNKKAENIKPPDPAPDYQPRRLGLRPASGFYIRHAQDIEFTNLIITHEKPDIRPAIVVDKSENILIKKADLPKSDDCNCHILSRSSKSIKLRSSNLLLTEIP